MRRSKQKHLRSVGCWCAVTVGLSVLVGIWNAKEPSSIRPEDNAQKNSPQVWAENTRLEQIESTLAQAGCPGWIVLAEEGETALQEPSASVPSNIKQASHQVTDVVPRVRYPVPIRVATRTRIASASSSTAFVSVGPADDPNDLLDGVPDLLLKPTESTPEQPPRPVQPVPQAEQTIEQPVEQFEIPPVEEPETPSEPHQLEVTPPILLEQPQVVAPQENQTSEPVEPEQLELDLPPQQPAPQSQQPAGVLPGPVKEPSFAPPIRPRLQQPESIEKPAPQQPLPPPAMPPAQQNPQQSPFAPPPASKHAAPHSTETGSSKSAKASGDTKTYCEFVAETNYPSAQTCAKCHEKIFEEWSVSSHAYAMISPMFHKFEQKINDLSQGTVGYFCYRCHSPVGTTLGISRAAPLWELPQVAREGVTCVACHRVNQRYGKVNGDRRIEPGDGFAPVYGPIGGSGVAEVIAKKDHYKVKTSPNEKGPGQDIHVAGMEFDQLSKSEFCVSCHQVAVHPGIKLEVVWEQYRASPACKKGVSCQDCHMGRIPGVASGYETGAAAKVGDKVVNSQRKHANHVFWGPGYSIAHPGIFPHNIDANRWSMQEWLLFDWRAGWGTEEFEDLVDSGRIQVNFPAVWAEVDDRYDAREIIEDNQKKLTSKRISRLQVLENGSHVDGPFFDSELHRGQDLKFHYVMTNTNDGHNLPTGSLGAQPQMWANVVLIGPRGQRLWETGYTDRWGDVADIHSEDVRNKLLPYDWQLFNLQTMFLITGAKGTDREFFLPVNFDFDQMPYLRPGAQPISTLNHPPFIRMEGRSLAPLGSRKIPYKVPAHLMCEPGHYRLSFRIRSRLEPIYFMRFCESTPEMIRSMNEGMIDFHQSSVEFFVR